MLPAGVEAPGRAKACVLGGLDVVSPLGRAGIACAVAVEPRNPVRWSRHVVEVVEALDPWTQTEAYVDRLVDWARRQPERPVLYYPTDADLLMVSRWREPLSEAFQLVVPDARLVEDLVDKGRFAELALRCGLSVPRSVVLRAGDPAAAADALDFPVVVKPVFHRGQPALGLPGKAREVATPADLAALWAALAPAGVDLLAQELVPGDETRIESYHAYVDAAGVVADFTGRKLQTYPAAFGETTRLTITDEADVRADGRSAVAALGLRGVCKIDYKRDVDGRLWMLEVNPRFNLWHNPGAAAGVNLPALVHADLTGTPRPAIGRVRTGVTWVDPVMLFRGARAERQSLRSWGRAVASATTWSTGDRNDPWPFLRGRLLARVGGRAVHG